MKVLAATKTGQGLREDDFNFTREGELVVLGTTHDGERVDSPCGCRRSFVGVESSKSTTTAVVVDVDMTADAYVERVVKAYVEDDEGCDPKGAEAKGRREAPRLLRLAKGFRVGAVIERRGDLFNQRS